jgi:hypothetical protein
VIRRFVEHQEVRRVVEPRFSRSLREVALLARISMKSACHRFCDRQSRTTNIRRHV